MNRNSVIIIGGGISGLAIGCYLQMNGYQTSIFEKNANCGGVSVAWKRGKYIFDGATNWLAGSGPASNMHKLLSEVFDFNDLQIVDPEAFMTIEHENETFHVYCDAERFKQEMLRLAPEDKKQITKFTDAVKKVSSFALPYEKPTELYSPLDYCTFLLTQLPFILFFSKWKRITLGQFAQKFSNSKLNAMFLKIFPRHEHFSVFSLVMTLGWMNVRSGGYPIGGSEKLIKQLVDKYRSSGGKLYTGAQVKNIELTENRAVGIRLESGDVYNAEKIVSSIDILTTIQQLPVRLPELEKTVNRYTHLPVYPSLIQVSLGIKRLFTDAPHKINMKLCSPVDLGEGGVLEEAMVRICNFDPSLAPQGSTSVIVHIRTSGYAYWQKLREQDYGKYVQMKKAVADSVINTLERRFENVKNETEIVDIATPATFIRYTSIYKGSYQGWAPTPALIGKAFPKTFKSIKNLYLTGQWVWPAGGIPGVIRISRQTAQIMCNKDSRPFSVR